MRSSVEKSSTTVKREREWDSTFVQPFFWPRADSSSAERLFRFAFIANRPKTWHLIVVLLPRPWPSKIDLYLLCRQWLLLLMVRFQRERLARVAERAFSAFRSAFMCKRQANVIALESAYSYSYWRFQFRPLCTRRWTPSTAHESGIFSLPHQNKRQLLQFYVYSANATFACGGRSTAIKKAINCLKPNPAIILTFSRFYRTWNLKKQIYSESTSWWYFNQETAAFYASKVRRAVLWGACTYCWLCLQLEIARHAYPLCVLAASAAISECRLRI